MRRALFLTLALVHAACGSDDVAIMDAGADGEADAAADGSMDAPPRADASSDAATDASSDVPVPSDASADATSDAPSDATPPRGEALATETGCFFTPTATDRVRSLRVGEGATYDHLEITFSVIAGPWQPHIPDPSNRTEHILFGLSRANQPRSFQRYLMGAAAVDFLSRPSHFRMYGREEIAMGAASYTQVSGVYDGWTEGSRYDVFCSIDATSDLQRCVLASDGTVLAARELVVDYLDAAMHMGTGFDLELGTDSPLDHDHLQTPQGWQFCDLVVTGRAVD